MTRDISINPDFVTDLLPEARQPETFEELHAIASKDNYVLHIEHKAIVSRGAENGLDISKLEALDFGAKAYELFGAHVQVGRRVDEFGAVLRLASINKGLRINTDTLRDTAKVLIKQYPDLAEGIYTLGLEKNYDLSLAIHVLGSAGLMQAAHQEIYR